MVFSRNMLIITNKPTKNNRKRNFQHGRSDLEGQRLYMGFINSTCLYPPAMEDLQNIPCTEQPSVPTLELVFHCSGGSLHIWIMAGLGMPNLRTKAFRSVNSFGLIRNSGCSESRSLTALVSRLDIIYQSSQLTEIHRQFLCFRNLHCFGEAFVRETPPATAGGSQRKPESKGTKGSTFHKQTNISQVTVNVPALSVPTFPASSELLLACLTLIWNEKYYLARRMSLVV